MEIKDFDEFQIDQLKEIMNIGASHASTALSQLVNQKVALTIPYAYIDKTLNIDKYFKLTNEKVSSAAIRIFGEISGLMYFLFSHENEEQLIKLLIGDIEDPKERMEMEESVIKEVGNILAGASLTAFSRFLNMSLLHSVSKVIVDTFNNVVKRLINEVSSETGTALIFQIDFSIKSNQISTHFLFFIDEEATKKILEALKKNY